MIFVFFVINGSGNYRQYAVWVYKDSAGSQPVVPNVTTYVQWPISTGQSSTATAAALATALNAVPNLDFSAAPGAGSVVVTNTSAGTCTAASVGTLPSPFAVVVTQAGTGIGNYSIKDGDNLTLGIKEVDEGLAAFNAFLNDPTYDETITIVASGATPPTSLNGPIAASTAITIPNNSRASNTAQYYEVGKGALEVRLNGLELIDGADWNEVGTANTLSNQISFNEILQVGDVIEIRLGTLGGPGGLGGPTGPAGPTGPQGVPGHDAAGGPVAISTKTSSYTVLLTDNVLLANCVGGNIVFTLPAASTATGHVFYCKKIDNSSYTMTIQGNGSDIIDGSNTQVVSTQYESLTLVTDGTSWYLI